MATVYDAVDLSRFEGAETLRAEFRIPAEAPVVAIVGQVCRRKGIRNFIEMVPHVLARVPEARFLIVGCDATGEEGYSLEMKALARRLRVLEHLLFTGFRRDVGRVMQTLDVLVLASLAEPFGKVVIEAMAAGKCVVATAVGGVPEIITDPGLGTLIPPEDPRALADGVIRYLEDAPLREATGARARRHVQMRFALDAMMRQIEQVYDELLSQERSWLSALRALTPLPWRSGAGQPG